MLFLNIFLPYNKYLVQCNFSYLQIEANDSEPTTAVFHSPDAFTNEKLVILIHGSGVVRAGQWARR